MIEERESKIIYILKAFAIISVVCAHISVVPDYFSPQSIYVNNILNEIGAIGVGLFFFLAGYLFAKKNTDDKFSIFMKKKIKTLGIPWVVSATLVYLYVSLRKGGSLLGWILSLIGYMSSYWYLTVLFILYMAFFFVKKQQKGNIIALLLMLASVVSVFLRMIGIIESNALGVYLNVFNWSIFFALGYLNCTKNSVLYKSNKYVMLILAVATIGIIFLFPILEIKKFSYFSYLYIPIEIAIIYISIQIAYAISAAKCRILKLLGMLSFSIYLYNELLWAGLIVNLGNKIDFWPLLLIRPILVLGAVVGELLIGRKIFALFNKTELFDSLTGVRLKALRG